MRMIGMVLFLGFLFSTTNCECTPLPPPLPDSKNDGDGGGKKEILQKEGVKADLEPRTENSNEEVQNDRNEGEALENSQEFLPDNVLEEKLSETSKDLHPDLFLEKSRPEPSRDPPPSCQYDPKFKKSCSVGTGECLRSGKNSICDGIHAKCDAVAATPSKEICDGKDNNCDGQVDNDLQAALPLCPKQQGVCMNSQQQCQQGKLITCNELQYKQHSPHYEKIEFSCDGKDNDCDGQIDNNLSAPLCQKQQGLCQGARKLCGGAKGWLNCTDLNYKGHNASYQPQETTCDGKDNNCDGAIDEGCQCTSPATKKCGQYSLGECKTGNQTCLSTGKWGICVGAISPKAEICDGKDNDCNGQIDNLLPTSLPLCPKQQGVCQNSRKQCVSGRLTFCNTTTYSAHSSLYQTQETSCDSKDNDCDGQIDNNLSAPLCQKQQGLCQGAKKLCGGAKGWIACTDLHYKSHNTSYQSQETSCDGKDNDCDGQIDEKCP